MNSTFRNFVVLLVAVVAAWIVLKIVLHLALALIFNIIVPLAIVGGVVYGCYVLFGRKALGGGRRYLP